MLEALKAIRQADLHSREMMKSFLHMREAIAAAEEHLEAYLETPSHEEGTAAALILGQAKTCSDRQSGSIEKLAENSLTSATGCGPLDSPGASASRGDRSETLSTPKD